MALDPVKSDAMITDVPPVTLFSPHLGQRRRLHCQTKIYGRNARQAPDHVSAVAVPRLSTATKCCRSRRQFVARRRQCGRDLVCEVSHSCYSPHSSRHQYGKVRNLCIFAARLCQLFRLAYHQKTSPVFVACRTLPLG